MYYSVKFVNPCPSGTESLIVVISLAASSGGIAAATEGAHNGCIIVSECCALQPKKAAQCYHTNWN